MFGVILGTGCGGGVVFRGDDGQPRAWEGAQGVAGEWGHVSLEPVTGSPCYCGRRGCVESFLSGTGIERIFRDRGGPAARVPEIARLAREGHELARAVLADTLDVFGRALATVINILDPDVVVLGGGVSNLEILYDEGARAVGRWVFNDVLETRIVKHALGDSAGVLGAALLPR